MAGAATDGLICGILWAAIGGLIGGPVAGAAAGAFGFVGGALNYVYGNKQ
jgi:hypothetical protein